MTSIHVTRGRARDSVYRARRADCQFRATSELVFTGESPSPHHPSLNDKSDRKSVDAAAVPLQHSHPQTCSTSLTHSDTITVTAP